MLALALAFAALLAAPLPEFEEARLALKLSASSRPP
jgi:hypothetical protein